MNALKWTKREHGLCQPRSRRACSHCNALETIDQMIADYKGPRIILS
jgi:hypothetical protein